MGDYGEIYRDMQEAQRLQRWVPRDEKLPELTPEQYRFILANLRETQAELKKIKDGLDAFRAIL